MKAYFLISAEQKEISQRDMKEDVATKIFVMEMQQSRTRLMMFIAQKISIY